MVTGETSSGLIEFSVVAGNASDSPVVISRETVKLSEVTLDACGDSVISSIVVAGV